MDPDPAIFFSDLQEGNKNYFFCLLLVEGTFTSFLKDKKVIKKLQNSRNQGFLTILLDDTVEGSESESVPLTNGSGSGRPKINTANFYLKFSRVKNLSLFQKYLVGSDSSKGSSHFPTLYVPLTWEGAGLEGRLL
jgi:hypothetical protein